MMKRCNLLLMLILLGASVLLQTACKPRIPVEVFSEAKMEEILYDYHLAQSAAERQGEDVEKNRYLYVQSVFQKHGVTEAEFDSSMVWYSAHSSLLQKIYERLAERYDAEMKGMGVGVSESEVYANLNQYGDTANIWSGARIIVLHNDRMNCLASINLKADSTFLPGDNYTLHFRASFTSNSHTPAYTFFNVFFKDGTMKSEFRMLHSSTDYSIILPEDINFNTRETDRINISFYFTPEKRSSDRCFMCIESPVLARYHKQKQQETPDVTSAKTDTIERSAEYVELKMDSSINEEVAPLAPAQTNQRDGFNLEREKAVRRPMQPVRRTSSGNSSRRRLN